MSITWTWNGPSKSSMRSRRRTRRFLLDYFVKHCVSGTKCVGYELPTDMATQFLLRVSHSLPRHRQSFPILPKSKQEETTMKRVGLVVSLLLLVVSAAFAGGPAPITPNNASLKGKYSFQLASSHFNTVTSNPVSCGIAGSSQPPQDYRTWYYDTKMEVDTGTATFDGAGNVTITGFAYGILDVSSSVAAISGVCDGTTGQVNWTVGQAVYFPSSPRSITGTYAISSDGTGAILLPAANANLIVRLAGYNATKGLATSFIMFDYQTNKNNAVDTAGYGFLQ